ncbi:tyrosinase cofactor [Streptomyces sp. NPDC048663]|uniref:apotyrosinase chaperone MelC1 n=1 Tax=Streptomyces sp. NPDC048663 TaxID=3155638 RepID=UPI00341614C3
MPELTRRRALTAAAALAAAAGATTLTAAATSAAAHPQEGALEPFDEVYKGRRIQGRPSSTDAMGGTGGHGGMAGMGGHHHGHGTGYAVFVDGVELHVMRNADGSWISVVSHYQPVRTPRAAARAAVDELQGAPLLPFPAN